MPLGASALLALTVGVVSIGGCEGRHSGPKSEGHEKDPVTGPALLELNLSRGVPELGGSSLFGASSGGSHADLVRALTHVDADTKGIFVRLGTASMGMSVAREVGGLLADLKNKGTPVVCHADGIQNGTLLLLSRGCSKIWLSPAGQVDSVGIAAQLIFGKSLLQKLGVGVDFLQVGKYKGAQEPFTRDEPSPEARESLEGTLRDIRTAWIADISAGRGRDMSELVEDGPYTPEAAKAAGLIDAVGFLDEARNAAKTDVSAERIEQGFGGHSESGGGVGEVLRELAGGDSSSDPHVEVVRAIGQISMSGGGGLLGGSGGISESGLGKTLTDLTHDDSVKAVVLRIDSPGGSALASDLLWHKLMLLRAKKPLIVSVGGMAASGGYYLSCSANRIFAEPTSIVGSIGVVGGKFSLHDPLATIGINTVTIPAATDPKKAARSSYLSTFDRWDDATRAKVLASMEGIYDTFLSRIAEGRNLPKEEVASFAEGRIFGGATAKDKHLVDELGGLNEAIAYAVKESGLGDDAAVHLYVERSALTDLLVGSAGGGDDESRAERAEAQAKAAASALYPFADLERALPPEAVLWLKSAWPMTEGEVTLAVVPYAIVLK